MPETSIESRIALEMVRITESAAIDSARYMGRGDNVAADHAATEAMRRTMDELEMRGTIVIGEGERAESMAADSVMRTISRAILDSMLVSGIGTSCGWGGVGG